jgi:3-hydroxybutyrate dehydrogenase
MNSLAGMHAVVTGGSRGIGAAITTALAREGATLSILGRDEARLEAQVAVLGQAIAVAGGEVM